MVSIPFNKKKKKKTHGTAVDLQVAKWLSLLIITSGFWVETIYGIADIRNNGLFLLMKAHSTDSYKGEMSFTYDYCYNQINSRYQPYAFHC